MILFVGIFEIQCLCKPSENPTKLKGNIREEMANVPAGTLVKVMTNTQYRYMQCTDNRGRHLHDMIFKTMQSKTLNMYYYYKTKLKPL